MRNVSGLTPEELAADIAVAMAEYKGRIDGLVDDEFRDQLGPLMSAILAETMLDMFRAGIMVGLGHSEHPAVETVLLTFVHPVGSA